MSSSSFFARAFALLVAALGTAAAAEAQGFSATGQFGAYSAPPYVYDDLYAEWVNLETELVEPILYLGAYQLVAVANDADDRVVFLTPNPLTVHAEVVVGQGPTALARNPGTSELWVSVRHQSSVVVIDLATFQVTHVLRPPVPASPTDPNAVGARAASAPGGIAFSQGRAYVAATDADQVVVYDAVTKAHVTSIALQWTHHGRPAALNDPFAVVSHDSKIYVVSRLSGNNTTSKIAGGLDLDEPGATRLDLGPDQVSIVDLDLDPSLELPDFDVAVIDPATNTVTGMAKGVGTILLGAAAHSQLNKLIVSNLESRNAEFVGEAAFPQGQVVLNRISGVNLNTLTVNPIVVTEALGVALDDIVMPTDIEVLTTGRTYVAGYGSANIGVWSANGTYEGAIPTPSGPRGLASARNLGLLFSYNRADGSVTSFDISSPPSVPSGYLSKIDLVNPTFDRVRLGRQEFLKPNSGAGTTSCMSCHVDGRLDGLAWNLSKTLSASPTGPNPDFRDRKGVMVTQDLRGLSGSAPYHWRGEQKDIDDFRGAFVNLLKGTEPTLDEFALMKDYMLSLEFPPNPEQGMNRVFTADAQVGASKFDAICNRCHQLPLGTNGDLTDNIIGDEAGSNAVETASLRGLWVRRSSQCDIESLPGSGDPEIEIVSSLGFGILHEGVLDDLLKFVDMFFGNSAALDEPHEQAEMVAFVEQLDTSLAPAAMDSEILNGATLASGAADKIPLFLVPQADAGNCDLVARGTLSQGSPIAIGLLYVPSAQHFLADDKVTTYTWSTLVSLATSGQLSAVFMGTPRGSGERIGVDRDRDGLYDRQELALGTDPIDPDTDGDGSWDSYDGSPLMPGGPIPVGAPTVVTGSVKVVYATTNAIKIVYDTSTFSPTILQFGEAGGPLQYTSGDGVLPAGSNRWKRRHTAFIRPVPTNSPQLLALRPNQAYDFRILTRGQNGAQGQSALMTTASAGNEAPPTFRASAIDLVQRVNNGNGTFSYTVEVLFEATDGVPVIDGSAVPGRFTFYDTSGAYVFTNQSAVIASGKATFTLTTQPGDQVIGDRTTFDVPMWCAVPGSPTLVSFPGDWSDGPSFLETSAPQ